MPYRRVPRPFDLHWGRGVIAEEASVLTPFHQPTIQLWRSTMARGRPQIRKLLKELVD